MFKHTAMIVVVRSSNMVDLLHDDWAASQDHLEIC